MLSVYNGALVFTCPPPFFNACRCDDGTGQLRVDRWMACYHVSSPSCLVPRHVSFPRLVPTSYSHALFPHLIPKSRSQILLLTIPCHHKPT